MKIQFVQRMLTILLLITYAAVADNAADPYTWLEEVEGEEALEWVEEQNKISLSYLEALPMFEPLRAQNLENYDSDEKILTPALRGGFVYNYWKDANNRRGLWRRTTLDDYIAGGPDWEIVLDLDALAAEEGEDWVWKGATCLRPDYRRCLLDLSRGGADATVVREFDVEDREFVADGFQVAEAKTIAIWVDQDTLYIGSDFGERSLTDSGYPRISRVWRRGEPIEEATEIFAGEQTDVVAYVERIWDGQTPYDIADRSPGFFTSLRYLFRESSDLELIDIPEDSVLHGVVNGQIIVELKTDWSVGGNDYAQGALMSINFERFMQGDRNFDVLLVPTKSNAIVRGGVARTRDYIIVNQLEDVVSKLMRFEFTEGAWVGTDIESPGIGKITLVTSDDETNVFFFNYESFLSPDILYVGNDGGASIEAVQSLPEYFDSDRMTVEQHFATSADGTKVPYFIALPKNFSADGSTPTLMYGYGGFQVSRPPSYSSTVGHSWLARGGAYVMANIRGGGEYGPRWHHAAMLEKRQRAYDDFIAIAEDLIERKITSPEYLGIRGGSNGGLLTGVMLTQRPDLFKGVVIQVPLLDMKRYHVLLAGASWMAEYGDPDTDDWKFISRYSPYHNLDPDVDYPVPFFTTSTRDDRVHPAHARKMVARMNEMGKDLYYYENTVGGHAGASDYAQAAKVEAMIYSYLWDQLGD